MATFIQATDGLFYNTPKLFGVDWWCDFDDDVRIIVRRFRNSTPQSAKTRASAVMHEAGISFKKLEYRDNMSRPFPPAWKVLEASCLDFQLTGPIPVPAAYHSRVEEVGHVWDHWVIGFESRVDPVDLMRCVTGGDISNQILRALLNEPVYKKQQERVRADVCKKLYAQFPWLREITKDNFEAEAKAREDKVVLQWRRE